MAIKTSGNDGARLLARRHFFADCPLGLARMAWASMLLPSASAWGSSSTPTTADPFHPRPSHFPAKAKRVIYLFMTGAPSHLDLFDPKPTLLRHDGKPVPAEVVKDQRYAFIRKDAALLAPRFEFRRHGASGMALASVLPNLANVVDDLAFVRSMTTDQFNHAPAQIFLNTGSSLPGRPSMGSWVTYGLGSESQDLPGFVVLSSGGGASGGASNWSSGFLPSHYQGVTFLPAGDPMLNVARPAGVDVPLQRETIDAVKSLNERRRRVLHDPEIAARTSSLEMAFRMQASAPELVDFSGESKRTLERYGADPVKPSFARNCLLARRLVERGVRFVQLIHEGWDHHSDVEGGLKQQCRLTDQASAALVRDLKERGLIEDTLVVWGGEFGRTPMVESNPALGRKLGRDHHPQAFTIWLAGAGVKAGQTLGATDELGFHVVDQPVHVHDLQATILHLLGLDHERLTHTFQGRKFRLTDVHGKVVTSLLA